MKIPVAYYSQYLDVSDPEWQNRACAVVCIKTLLASQGVVTPSIDEMIQKGLLLDAHMPDVGWRHDGLIKLAFAYGGVLARREWRKSDIKSSEELLEEGINFLVATLRAGFPIAISAIKKFSEEGKFHMVVLIGFEEEGGIIKGFWYHDPDSRAREGGEGLFVDFETFKKTWRRMAIFPA